MGFRGLRTPSRSVVIDLRDRYEGLLRSILAEAAASGALVLQDVAETGRFILSALNWMARWYQPNGPRTASEIVEGYATILLDGMRPRPAPISAEGTPSRRRRPRGVPRPA